MQKRLPPSIRHNAGQRAIAATKIQRMFRDHLRKRQSQAAVIAISSSLLALRRSNVARTPNDSSLRPLYPSRPVCLDGYQSRLKALQAQLEELMVDIHPAVRVPAKRLLLQFKEELDRVQIALMDAEIKALRKRARSPSPASGNPCAASFPATPKRCTRKSSMSPSLETITESEE